MFCRNNFLLHSIIPFIKNSDTAEQLEPKKGEISHPSATKPSSKGGVDIPMPSLNPQTTLVECLEKSFGSNESDIASESSFEFDPLSPDSIFDESNIFELPEKSHLDNPRPSTSRDPPMDSWPPSKLMQVPIRNLLRVKKGVSWDFTLGDIVQEIFLHLQPAISSTIKEVLTENTSPRCICMSSISGCRATVSTASEDILSDSYTSSFVQLNYGIGEDMKEMEKILDNPWNPDETINLSRLQIETMDSWKKDFGRLNKVLEDKEARSVEDPWSATTIDVVSDQNSGSVVSSTISTSNPNQTSQVQHNSPLQAQGKAISTRKGDRATVKPQKPFRVYVFPMLFIIVIAAVATFVVLELGFYRSHVASVRGDVMWLIFRQTHRRNQFFLPSNFV